MSGRNLIEELRQNLRYAARMLRRSPLFTTVAIVSLALGLGATTAVFSFVRAIALKRLPVSGADRLVILRQHNEMFHMENCCFSYPFFREIRKQDLGFEDILALTSTDINVRDYSETERLRAEIVSGNYFRMFGVHPAAGRLLDENDDQAEGASPVCVISYRLWQERYGGRADVIGRRVFINNNQPFQIVGVSEPGFTGGALHEPHGAADPGVDDQQGLRRWPRFLRLGPAHRSS